MSQEVFEVYDICGFLKSEAPHLRVSMEDLKSPKMEIICEIYRWFVLQVTSSKESTIDDVQQDLAHLLEEPAFFETSLAILQLTLALDFILLEIGSEEKVTIQDILFPTHKKTVIILSTLMRFYMFVRQRSAFIESCMESAREIAEEKRILVQNNNELRERISAIRAGMTEREGDLKRIKEIKAQLIQKCQSSMEIRKKVEENAKISEDQLKSMMKVLKDKKQEKESLSERNAFLLNQIVHSPEKLKSEIEELKRKKSDYEQNKSALNGLVLDLEKKLAELPRIERMLDLLLESIESVTEEVKKQDELLNKKENLVAQIHKLRIEINSASRIEQEKRENLANRCEKYAKLVQQQNRRFKDMENEIVELQQKIADKEKDLGENEVVAMDFDEQCRQIRNEVSQMICERENQFNICRDKREKLFRALEIMNKSIIKHYEKLDEKMNF